MYALWKRISALLACVAVLALISGCGSLSTRKLHEASKPSAEQGQRNPCYTVPKTARPYGGVSVITRSIGYTFKHDSPDIILLFFDLPFSLVADTIMLPLTIYEQIRFGSYCKEPPEGTREGWVYDGRS